VLAADELESVFGEASGVVLLSDEELQEATNMKTMTNVAIKNFGRIMIGLS